MLEVLLYFLQDILNQKRERYNDPVVGFARYIDLPTTKERERERKRSGPGKHARPRISRVAKREV